jgi:hypothetical protein
LLLQSWAKRDDSATEEASGDASPTIMLIILAGEQDEVARDLARRWSSFDAHLVRPKDLSQSGWCHRPGSRATESRDAGLERAPKERLKGRISAESYGQDVAIVGGRAISAGRIDGVLTRLPCVFEWELVHIVPGDRAYVSAEMTAFLLSWLSGLDCPILNRPTPNCLSGPGWRQEQWLHLAARLGIPVDPVKRYATLGEEASIRPGSGPLETVTVVGKRCFNAPDERQAVHAQRLAAATGVGLLALHFTASHHGLASLRSVNTWPDISSSEVANAILELLRGRSA